MDESLRQRVLQAASSADLDIPTRNHLYAALGRALRNDQVPAEALARWAQAGEKRGQAKFNFLKEWCQDTTFGHLRVAEERVVAKEAYIDNQWMWVTRTDLLAKFGTVPGGQEYVEKLLGAARATKPHPMFPRDRDMRMHKVLSSLVEGVKNQNLQTRACRVESEVATKEQGEAVEEALRREGKLQAATHGLEDLEEDNEDDEKGDKKTRVPSAGVSPSRQRSPNRKLRRRAARRKQRLLQLEGRRAPRKQRTKESRWRTN